uniref:Uncharacterized protein n=1 Tax=Panagrolaimus davidi TaxID=227884 RepID=A0A914PVR2_9BILA
MLKHLTLISCYIEKLTDEFFDILPKTLLSLCLNGNEITKISKKISEFTRLRDLELNDNKELGDFSENKKLGDTGFPWAFLPPSLVHLKLKRTNISIIPTEINRLQHLETLEISSKNLKKVEWFEISDTIVRLIIEGGNQLNEIELTSKLNLTTLHILQTGLTVSI